MIVLPVEIKSIPLGEGGTHQESPLNLNVLNHRSTGIKPAGAGDISADSGAKSSLHRYKTGGGGGYFGRFWSKIIAPPV